MKKSVKVTLIGLGTVLGLGLITSQVLPNQNDVVLHDDKVSVIEKVESKKKEEAKKSTEKKTEIVVPADKQEEVDTIIADGNAQLEQAYNDFADEVAPEVPVSDSVEVSKPANVNTPVVEENAVQATTGVVKVEQPKTLEEVRPDLWITLVNIGKTVGETPNPAWDEATGQAKFDEWATRLHDNGGVPREKGVK